MQTTLNHIQINVRSENLSFYADLFEQLGWQTLYADGSMLGIGDTNRSSVWFIGRIKDDQRLRRPWYESPGNRHCDASRCECDGRLFDRTRCLAAFSKHHAIDPNLPPLQIKPITRSCLNRRTGFCLKSFTPAYATTERRRKQTFGNQQLSADNGCCATVTP